MHIYLILLHYTFLCRFATQLNNEKSLTKYHMICFCLPFSIISCLLLNIFIIMTKALKNFQILNSTRISTSSEISENSSIGNLTLISIDNTPETNKRNRIFISDSSKKKIENTSIIPLDTDKNILDLYAFLQSLKNVNKFFENFEMNHITNGNKINLTKDSINFFDDHTTISTSKSNFIALGNKKMIDSYNKTFKENKTNVFPNSRIPSNTDFNLFRNKSKRFGGNHNYSSKNNVKSNLSIHEIANISNKESNLYNLSTKITRGRLNKDILKNSEIKQNKNIDNEQHNLSNEKVVNRSSNIKLTNEKNIKFERREKISEIKTHSKKDFTITEKKIITSTTAPYTTSSKNEIKTQSYTRKVTSNRRSNYHRIGTSYLSKS